ncbi:MAG: TAXI family TRAP transporter solute-binding subunit [Alphaproteobacteria bacterium]|nr:TAXI family TRAP transporter solute-binding subunit [Alphaproteobacteria bacterium]
MIPPSNHLPDQQSALSRIVFITLAAVLAAVTALVFAWYFAMRPVTLKIAVGPVGSDDFKLVQALTQAFAQSHAVRLRQIGTDGAAASARALAEGKVDLAIVRGDQSWPRNAQAVATLRKNVVVLWAPSKAMIRKGRKHAGAVVSKISQLAGRRVGIIDRSPADAALLKVILRQYSIDPAKVELVQFSVSEANEAIRSRRADAWLTAGPVNSKITASAIAASAIDGGRPTFLAIDSAEAIAQDNPVYESEEIPAGAFGGSPDRPGEAIKTIGFSHHIAVRKSLSENTVAAFTRSLFAVRQQLMAEFPLAAKIETPDTDKDAVIPVHPGAAAFVDGEEKSFLDRYSDYIWWSLMGLSAMGSVGAWFAGHLRPNRRAATSHMRERLLDMMASARRTDSGEELDQIQRDADSVLRDTLRAFESGAINDTALTAFNIALEQLHAAVGARRAELSPPPGLQRLATPIRAAGNG